MSCDDCKKDKLTFSYFLEDVDPIVEIKSRYDPTPNIIDFDPSWAKLCVDCIKEKQKAEIA